MERRHFLKVAFGFAAGIAAVASTSDIVKAAPLVPQPLLPDDPIEPGREAEPALATGDDLDRAHVEEVRWHWGFRRHWRRRRFWGFRRRWHRRHYRRWHRRRWRRRFW